MPWNFNTSNKPEPEQSTKIEAFGASVDTNNLVIDKSDKVYLRRRSAGGRTVKVDSGRMVTVRVVDRSAVKTALNRALRSRAFRKRQEAS